jgi:hypothetical protein
MGKEVTVWVQVYVRGTKHCGLSLLISMIRRGSTFEYREGPTRVLESYVGRVI